MNLVKIMLPLLSASVLMASSGETIFQSKCSPCHGKMGEKKVLGKSKIIRGMSLAKFVEITNAFASGEKKAEQMSKVVKQQFVHRYTKEEMQAVAEYINKL